MAFGAFKRFCRHHVSASLICRSASSLTSMRRRAFTGDGEDLPALARAERSGHVHTARLIREAFAQFLRLPRKSHRLREGVSLRLRLQEESHLPSGFVRQSLYQMPLACRDSTQQWARGTERLKCRDFYDLCREPLPRRLRHVGRGAFRVATKDESSAPCM